MSPEDRDALARQPSEITVYRGVGNPDYEEGLSWTLSQEQAARFARRSRGELADGVVLKGVANKKDVHAFFTSRKEQEIVVSRVSVVSRECILNNGDDG